MMTFLHVFFVVAVDCLRYLAAGNDVFASSAHVQLLAEGELRMTEALSKYLVSEKRRLSQLEQIFQNLREDQRSTGAPLSLPSAKSLTDPPSPVLDHPLNAYHLIRRYETSWKSVNIHVFDFDASTAFNLTLNELENHLPVTEDFRGARLALVRLQMTYNLSLNNLISGVVQGRQSLPLSQKEVVETALTAINSSLPNEAISWLEMSFNHTRSPLAAKQQIYHGLSRAYALKGDFMKTIEFIGKALELDSTNPEYIQNILPDSWKPEYFKVQGPNEYAKLCYDVAFDLQKKPVEVCEYQTSTLTPIQRSKVEYVYRSPDVLLFHDFVTQREADELFYISLNRIQRAKVGNGRVSDIRIGKVAWLHDSENNTLIRRISRRISDVTNLDVKTSEPLQMSNYGIGGHYGFHYDTLRSRSSKEENYTWTAFPPRGDRIATFMLYLTEVTLGGATVFPHLQIGTKPVKNAAVFWYNYDRSGQIAKDSIHAGCPVLLGEKWVANKWIHEYGQEFRRPCITSQAA